MRSAGDGGAGIGGERSRLCREYLTVFLEDTEHCVVLTPEMRSEWERHWSKFSRVWRLAMDARKRVHRIRPDGCDERQERIEATASVEAHRLAMAKDCHLLDAALASDGRISSLDEKVRDLFSVACRTQVELQELIWVNPEIEDEDGGGWLRAGAPPERHRTLRARADSL